MTQNEIKQILDRQRAFFHTGATLDVSYRLDSLRRLCDLPKRAIDEELKCRQNGK